MSFFAKLRSWGDDPEWRAALGRAAERVGGRVVTAERAWDQRILVPHRGWVVTVDTYAEQHGQVAVRYTRARAFFHRRAELRLLMRRKNALDRMAQALGFAGFVPGDRGVAEKYVTRGKPTSRLRSVVGGGLATAILAQPSLRLEVRRAPRTYRKRWGDATDEACARTEGIVRDGERLVGLVDVVRECLDALARVGAADPLPSTERSS